MKTMRSVEGKRNIRVSDERASKLFEEGFRYVSKSMWKEKVRDVNKEEKTTKKKTKKKKVRKVK